MSAECLEIQSQTGECLLHLPELLLKVSFSVGFLDAFRTSRNKFITTEQI